MLTRKDAQETISQWNQRHNPRFPTLIPKKEMANAAREMNNKIENVNLQALYNIAGNKLFGPGRRDKRKTAITRVAQAHELFSSICIPLIKTNMVSGKAAEELSNMLLSASLGITMNGSIPDEVKEARAGLLLLLSKKTTTHS